MDNAKHAIEYAQKGWYVFPIQPNLKVPYRGMKWKEKSTNNIDKIKKVASHEKYKDCNWAIDCAKSGVSIVDVDLYKPHYKNCDILNGDRDTLTVLTARGGFQYYYADPNKTGRNSTEKLAPAIDTRGAGSSGYALIPGSKFQGRFYKLHNDKPLKNYPVKLVEKLGAPIERDPNWNIPFCDLDEEANVKNAINYLEHAEPAIQGYGGNAWTYKTACRLRDMGISENMSVELMLEHWYPNCTPNNKPEFVEKLVRNANQYAKKAPGNDTPAAIFPTQQTTIGPIELRCAADINPTKFQPRQWLLRYRYLIGYVTVTIAPGGVGKSALTILEGLSVASGKQLCHHKVVGQVGAGTEGKVAGVRGQNVWMFNTEDPYDELEKRVYAAARQHNLTKEDLGRFFYKSAYDAPVKFVGYSDGVKKVVVNEKLVSEVIRVIQENEIRLFIIDPFLETHGVNENDNTEMGVVVQVFRRIAAEGQCAVSLVHHTSKIGKGGSEDSARGDANKARGAGAVVNASRITNTVYMMSEKEAREYGVSVGLRKWYVRMDHGKDNLSPPDAVGVWYKKYSVGTVGKGGFGCGCGGAGGVGLEEQETTVAMGKVSLESVRVADLGEVYVDLVADLLVAVDSISLLAIAKEVKLRGLNDSSEVTICRAIERSFANVIKKDDFYYELTTVKNKRTNKKVKGVKKVKAVSVS